ncbi:hypothetical protein NKR23_g12091 [Pleurostoma richardsiae]|uniref:Uncharacterized protein n=1 Tax=Pleurostoma richardsiae TaxID=41990 RepID=A0AA38R8I8_9PEZI|nr:hypothetical protein NKR23_g12091 [Pleurostoma richardsiae]
MAKDRTDKTRKRSRTRENVQKSLRRMMKRIDRMKKTYGVEFYFCAKYYKFYEYMSSPYFRPTAREINENYPPSVKSTPSSFPGRHAC